jgi:hypothetical protein
MPWMPSRLARYCPLAELLVCCLKSRPLAGDLWVSPTITPPAVLQDVCFVNPRQPLAVRNPTREHGSTLVRLTGSHLLIPND